MTVYDNLIANEEPATKYIPYSKQITPTSSSTIERDVTCTIQCDGIPFETMSAEEINGFSRAWFAAINTLGANNSRVALWSHVIRSKLRYDLSDVKYDNYFSQLFGDQIAARIEKKTYFQNELFLSPVYRAAPGRAERIGAALDKQGAGNVMAVASEEMTRISGQMMRSLRRYNPKLLGVEEFEDGDRGAISHLQAFYSRLLYGDVAPIPLDSYSVRYAIQRGELHFGKEIIAIEGPTSTRYAAVVGIKAPYGAEKARANIFHGLLSLPFELVLSQSITFLPVNKADKFLQTQMSQFSSTDGNSLQLAELKSAREALQAGKFGMAEHELILTIYGDSIQEVNEGINEAIAVLEDKSLTLMRKKRGKLITQYFGMLPGNFLTGRLDAVPVSTDNFSAFFPLHNFFTGNAQGSQWGAPVALMESTSNGPVFINYHVSRRRLKNQGIQLEYTPEEQAEDDVEDQEEADGVAQSSRRAHKKELGNYQIIGPSGSGKTLTKLMLRALMRKKRGRGLKPFKTFAWDKDSGEEILIRALGGVYFLFEDGKSTGLNPFSLEPTPGNLNFIVDLFMWCASKDITYLRTADDEAVLKKTVLDVYKLRDGLRRPARLMDTLPGLSNTVIGSGGARITSLKAALTRWVEGGQFAWVLDNPRDLFDLTKANDFGFDMTKFLDNEFARTPIQLLINHKIEESIDGSPFVLDVAEAWKAFKDPFMQEFINDKAKTVRKLQGIIGLDTQDPTDLSQSPIRGTLLQQFPTQIVLPNDRAKKDDYMEGMGLTDREFKLVSEDMLDEPGKFLFKQGKDSVVVRNDLAGMDDMIAVLSASIDNVPLVRDLIDAHGPNPEIWLPQFFRQRV